MKTQMSKKQSVSLLISIILLVISSLSLSITSYGQTESKNAGASSKTCSKDNFNPFGLTIDLNYINPKSPEELWVRPIIATLGGQSTCKKPISLITFRITRNSNFLIKGDKLSKDPSDGFVWDGTNNNMERVSPVFGYYVVALVTFANGEMVEVSRPIHFEQIKLQEKFVLKKEADKPVIPRVDKVAVLDKVRVVTTGGYDYLGIVETLMADRYIVNVDYIVDKSGNWEKQNNVIVNIPTPNVKSITKFQYD